jgi:hypothetical protein
MSWRVCAGRRSRVRHEVWSWSETMKDQEPERWERMLDRELAALPEREAPEALLGRVMEAVHERSVRPWWRCSWQSWPPGLQAVALLLLLVTGGAVSYLGAVALEEIRMVGVDVVLGSWLEPVGAGLDLLSTMWRAAWLVFKAGGQQLLLLVVLFVMGLYVACVGLGTACARVLLSRT